MSRCEENHFRLVGPQNGDFGVHRLHAVRCSLRLLAPGLAEHAQRLQGQQRLRHLLLLLADDRRRCPHPLLLGCHAQGLQVSIHALAVSL